MGPNTAANIHQEQLSALRITMGYTALIQKLWDVAWDLWHYRNSILHAGNKISEYFCPELLEAQIREEFLRGAPHPLPNHYRHWFSFPTVNHILPKNVALKASFG